MPAVCTLLTSLTPNNPDPQQRSTFPSQDLHTCYFFRPGYSVPSLHVPTPYLLFSLMSPLERPLNLSIKIFHPSTLFPSWEWPQSELILLICLSSVRPLECQFYKVGALAIHAHWRVPRAQGTYGCSTDSASEIG